MSTDRPEYIRCIQHTHAARKGTSWCGRPLASFDWSFVDIDHAVYSTQSGSRLLACKECVDAVVKALSQEAPE